MTIKPFSEFDALLFLASLLVFFGVIWAIGYARREALTAGRDPYTEWQVAKWRANERLGKALLAIMAGTFAAWLIFR